jgi:uncharacterized membrane protein
MNTNTFAELGLIAVVMLALDAAWLMGQNAYHRQVFAAVQGQPMVFRAGSAAIVYALMIAGLWWFVVSETEDWRSAGLRGAVLGAVVYGVYDFTNHATLARYPLYMAVSDFVWGAVLFGTTAAVTKALLQ